MSWRFRFVERIYEKLKISLVRTKNRFLKMVCGANLWKNVWFAPLTDFWKWFAARTCENIFSSRREPRFAHGSRREPRFAHFSNVHWIGMFSIKFERKLSCSLNNEISINMSYHSLKSSKYTWKLGYPLFFKLQDTLGSFWPLF